MPKKPKKTNEFLFPDKLTKIVATIGPVSETKEVLREMILSGMNVARFNSKHGTPEWHHERILRVKEVAKELNMPVGVLLDLQGPEVRLTLPDEVADKGCATEEGEIVIFTADKKLVEKKEKIIFVPEVAVSAVKIGQLVLIDDGLCQLQVTQKDKNFFKAEVMNGCVIKNRKTMSFPGLLIDMPVLIENDYVQLDGIKDNEVDYVALSFARNKSDILTLRRELEKRNLTAGIVAKIENQHALDNIDEIIEASDAVMVARGDLAIEVPYERLIQYQRKIIQKCREQAKPVITATHMLETMINSPFPTRAEISDVAHAVYDLTDAVMLSGETTIGKYPVKTVQVQANIVAHNENFIEADYLECITDNGVSNLVNAVSSIAMGGFFDVDFIVCLTETGRTAALLSRNRPKVPVHVITSTQRVYDKLTLYFGLIPHLVNWPEEEKLLNAEEVLKRVVKKDWLVPGKKTLVLHGPVWGKPGHTNTLSFITLK